MQENNPTLTTATTQQLLEEFAQRCDMLIIGYRHDGNDPPVVSYVGGTADCLATAVILRRRIEDAIISPNEK